MLILKSKSAIGDNYYWADSQFGSGEVDYRGICQLSLSLGGRYDIDPIAAVAIPSVKRTR